MLGIRIARRRNAEGRSSGFGDSLGRMASGIAAGVAEAAGNIGGAIRNAAEAVVRKAGTIKAMAADTVMYEYAGGGEDFLDIGLENLLDAGLGGPDDAGAADWRSFGEGAAFVARTPEKRAAPGRDTGDIGMDVARDADDEGPSFI